MFLGLWQKNVEQIFSMTSVLLADLWFQFHKIFLLV